MTIERKPQRGRKPRQTADSEQQAPQVGSREERGQRRRRRGSRASGKLGVNQALLDHSRFVYRWVNDTPGRVQTLLDDDWDLVIDPSKDVKDDSTDLGAAVSVIVGSQAHGAPLRAYLCRKPKEYYEEDEAEKQAELDEQLDNLRRGLTKTGETQGDYRPKNAISIA